jgi:hypothetical protein
LQPDVNSKTKAIGKDKRLYKGIFMLGSKTIIRRTKAHSAQQAKVFMIQRIAKEKKVANVGCLIKVFDGHLDNFIIEEES